jgi:hypothetical protein
LERFAISIMQARVVFSPESVQDVILRILNPPKPELPEPAETPAAASPETLSPINAKDPYVPAFAFPESQTPELSNEPAPFPIAETQATSQVPRRIELNKKQWTFLIVMFVIWFFLIAGFLFLVIKDQWSFLLSLLP